jgi:hypothetical protein
MLLLLLFIMFCFIIDHVHVLNISETLLDGR